MYRLKVLKMTEVPNDTGTSQACYELKVKLSTDDDNFEIYDLTYLDEGNNAEYEARLNGIEGLEDIERIDLMETLIYENFDLIFEDSEFILKPGYEFEKIA